MPVTYKIYPAKKLIHTKCIGDVGLGEVTDHFRELAQDPIKPDRLNVLLDLSETSSLPETQQIKEVSHQIEEFRRNVQFELCAIVACNDALFGMMRMFEVYALEYFVDIQVFRSVVDAEAWLTSYGRKAG